MSKQLQFKQISLLKRLVVNEFIICFKSLSIFSMNEKANLFLSWFQELNDEDQSDAIDLVYDEFKVRGMVEGVVGLSPEQRIELFGRLGIPKGVQEKLIRA